FAWTSAQSSLYRMGPGCRGGGTRRSGPDISFPAGPSRVHIYLPIADLPVDIFLVLGMGLAVGFISGMFGIGGGFLMTPLLIFIGISPAVAVVSRAND